MQDKPNIQEDTANFKLKRDCKIVKYLESLFLNLYDPGKFFS